MYFVMKIIMILVVICSVGNGGRVKHNEESAAVITKFYIEDWRPDGYSFAYETSSGTSRKEHGYFKKDNKGNQFLVTEGEFSYISENKEIYKVSYIADENGYRPNLPQKMSQNMTSIKKGTDQEDENIWLPDEEFDFYTTRDSTRTVGASTTESPTFTEEYPLITTLFPDDNETDLGDRFGPALIGSLLGKK